MKSFVALLVLSVGLASAAQDEVLCKCTKMYTPICGSDGVTYNNLCLLKCHQKVTPGLSGVSIGRCEDQKAYVKEPMCPCPRIYMPLCGSDGVTYNNYCLLKCQQQANKDLTSVHKGRCDEQVESNVMAHPCICTREYMPVCGSDGVTYDNKCMFRCQQSQSNGLSMAHLGECMAPKKVQEDVCICTDDYTPVCGSDGVTYPNLCGLQCKQKSNNGLAVAYQGECQNKEDVCICTLEYAPVCGSDGVTYPNKCNLKCKQRSNTDLTFKYSGEC